MSSERGGLFSFFAITIAARKIAFISIQGLVQSKLTVINCRPGSIVVISVASCAPGRYSLLDCHIALDSAKSSSTERKKLHRIDTDAHYITPYY